MATQQEDLLWYFAYGSNMNDKVLKRRRVTPKRSVPTKVPGWRLTYDLRGMPFVEPSFADIEPITKGDDTPEVQGVCHLITQHEFDGIVATEGGGGVAKHGYHQVFVDAIPVQGEDRTPIKAISLSVGPDPAMKHHGKLHLPSRRYVRLLVDGAKHYQLEPQYIEWLESHTCYNRSEHVRHTALFYLLFAGLLPLALPVLFIFLLNTFLMKWLSKSVYRKWSYVAHTFLQTLGRVIWFYHDTVFLIFGRFGLITVTTGGSKNVLCSPKNGRFPPNPAMVKPSHS